MPRRAVAAWALSCSLIVACSDDDDDDDVQPDACSGALCLPGDAGTDAQLDSGGMDAEAGTMMDSRVPLPDAASDARTDASDAATSGGPSITSAQVRQVGAFGQDLRLNVFAQQGAAEIVAARVELLGTGGVLLETISVPLASSIAGQGAASLVLSNELTKYPDLTEGVLTLIDADGRTSTPVKFTIVRQPVLTEGAECDDELIENRCGDGLGCRGPDQLTCKPGVQPTLDKVGYFIDSLGTRIVLAGTDPDRDVATYTVTFLGDQGDPVQVDIDGDPDTAPVSTFTERVGPQADGTFFKQLTPSDVLLTQVESVRVKVTDEADLSSTEVTVARTSAPLVAPGGVCDPRGFDRCDGNTLCVRGLGDSTVCTAVADAQTAACETAMVLNPSAGMTSVRGMLSPSRWNPPLGCSFARERQPDAVVKLVLTAPTPRLVLSTDVPYTGADTELYLLRTCTEMPRLAWCASDQPDPAPDPQAVLTLTNVMAGEYYVVVDSFPSAEATSNAFELTVTVD